MATFVRCCGSGVSRLTASQPNDGAFRARPRKRGNEPDDRDAACASSDVGSLISDGCGDRVSDFKAGASFRYAHYRLAINSPNPRYRRMVRVALWFVTSAVMEKAFRKDLSHLSWDEVYARQVSLPHSSRIG